MRMGWAVLCAIAACGGSSAAPAPRAEIAAIDAGADARPRPVIAAKRVEPPASCDAPLRDLRAEVHREFLARIANTPRAVVQLRTMPDECRGASWWLVAAYILRRWERPIDIGADADLADPAQALELGLAAGDDRELLELVAFASSLGGKPDLPADACDRFAQVRPTRPTTYSMVRRNDGSHYVCAHAALRNGDPARAIEELDQLNRLAWYPDLELLRARALIALGRGDEARAVITRPRNVSNHAAVAFGITEREGKLLDAEVARLGAAP
jgi:hypothetical protein